MSKTILRRNLFNVIYIYVFVKLNLYLFIRSRLTTYTSKSVTKTRTMEIRRMKRYSQSLEKRSFTMNYSKKDRFQYVPIAELCLHNIQRENLVFKNLSVAECVQRDSLIVTSVAAMRMLFGRLFTSVPVYIMFFRNFLSR